MDYRYEPMCAVDAWLNKYLHYRLHEPLVY